ncbi:MAG TPA: helix-turn-helix domain-containing protein [Anaerolineae bacterium]|nr:helix-turn-helix domain-containing protein [Anaerolineae bacterium]
MPPTTTSSDNLVKSPLMTPKELCALLNISCYTLKKLIKEFELPVIYVGNARRFERPAVEAWVVKNYINAPHEKNGKMQNVSRLKPEGGGELKAFPVQRGNVLAAQSAD